MSLAYFSPVASKMLKINVQQMSNKCLTNVQQMSNKCPTNVLQMSNKCPTNVQQMSEVHPQNFKVSLNVFKMFKKCLKTFLRHLFQILSGLKTQEEGGGEAAALFFSI